MEITSTLMSRLGQESKVVYKESDPMIDLEGKRLQSAHAFCFYKGKMVLVNHPKSGWQPPGGGMEAGETVEQATEREVREETNMKVLFQKVIGYQDVYEPAGTIRQVRSFCIVEPYGDFIADPDGEIQEIQLIDPEKYKEYFNWKEIGDRVMTKALLYFAEYKNSI